MVSRSTPSIARRLANAQGEELPSTEAGLEKNGYTLSVPLGLKSPHQSGFLLV